MGDSDRRQIPNGEILLLSPLVLSPEWPTQFWGKKWLFLLSADTGFGDHS